MRARGLAEVIPPATRTNNTAPVSDNRIRKTRPAPLRAPVVELVRRRIPTSLFGTRWREPVPWLQSIPQQSNPALSLPENYFSFDGGWIEGSGSWAEVGQDTRPAARPARLAHGPTVQDQAEAQCAPIPGRDHRAQL